MAKPETGAPHKSAAERRRQLYSDVWQLYTLTARRDSPVGGSGGNAALYKRRVRRRQGLSRSRNGALAKRRYHWMIASDSVNDKGGNDGNDKLDNGGGRLLYPDTC